MARGRQHLLIIVSLPPSLSLQGQSPSVDDEGSTRDEFYDDEDLFSGSGSGCKSAGPSLWVSGRPPGPGAHSPGAGFDFTPVQNQTGSLVAVLSK